MATINMRTALAATMATTDDMAAHAVKVSNFMRKAPIVAGTIIGGAAVVDWGMDAVDNNRAKREAKRMRRQEKKENTRTDEAKEIAYTSMPEFENFVQSLWEERSRHSNRWGGRLY